MKARYKVGDVIMYEYLTSSKEKQKFILQVVGKINFMYKLKVIVAIKGTYNFTGRVPRDHLERNSFLFSGDIGTIKAIYGN